MRKTASLNFRTPDLGDF